MIRRDGSQAGKDVGLTVDIDEIVAVGRLNHILLTKQRIEETMDIVAPVVNLFPSQLRRLDTIHPGWNFIHRIFIHLTGDRIDDDHALSA